MKCYICESDMELVGDMEIDIIGLVREYECCKCKEIVYEVLKTESKSEGK